MFGPRAHRAKSLISNRAKVVYICTSRKPLNHEVFAASRWAAGGYILMRQTRPWLQGAGPQRAASARLAGRAVGPGVLPLGEPPPRHVPRPVQHKLHRGRNVLARGWTEHGGRARLESHTAGIQPQQGWRYPRIFSGVELPAWLHGWPHAACALGFGRRLPRPAGKLRPCERPPLV